jgi:hypothetical protein
MKKGVLLTTAILVLALSLANVSGKSCLGHTVEIDSLVLGKGEIGEYAVSFFNLCEDPINLELSTEYPSDLRVEIHPPQIILKSEITNIPSKCEDCSWFILSNGGYPGRYAKTHPIRIYVKIPSEVSRNLYNLKITATATTASSGGQGLRQQLAQVREIYLKAYVGGTVEKPPQQFNNTQIPLTPSDFEGSSQGTALSAEEPEWQTGGMEKQGQTTQAGGSQLPSGQISLADKEETEKQGHSDWFNYAIVFLILLVIIITLKKR